MDHQTCIYLEHATEKPSLNDLVADLAAAGVSGARSFLDGRDFRIILVVRGLPSFT